MTWVVLWSQCFFFPNVIFCETEGGYVSSVFVFCKSKGNYLFSTKKLSENIS